MDKPKKPERLDRNDERARLRLDFLRYYLRDGGFARALRQLVMTKRDEGKFCRRWGLTFRDHEAETAVQTWCEQYRLYGGRALCRWFRFNQHLVG